MIRVRLVLYAILLALVAFTILTGCAMPRSTEVDAEGVRSQGPSDVAPSQRMDASVWTQKGGVMPAAMSAGPDGIDIGSMGPQGGAVVSLPYSDAETGEVVGTLAAALGGNRDLDAEGVEWSRPNGEVFKIARIGASASTVLEASVGALKTYADAYAKASDDQRQESIAQVQAQLEIGKGLTEALAAGLKLLSPTP
jgi:hypothetical protein